MILNTLIEFDVELFHYINSTLRNPVFDLILKWIRVPLFWMPLYTFILAFLFYNFPLRKVYVFLLFLALTGASTDFVSSTVIKKTVKRIRPCNDVALKHNVHLLARCGSGYSFTSSHATNHFGIAVFIFMTLGRLFKWFRWPFIFWAGAISFAQVYVGVHFPLDVIAGGILGIFIGKLVFTLFRKYGRSFIDENEEIMV